MARLGKFAEAGELLRAARIRSRKKRPAIAKVLRLTAQCVDFWEWGQNRVPIDKIDKVAEVYEMDDAEKGELIRLYYPPRMPSDTTPVALSPEPEVIKAWLTLPEESRKRVLAMMNAYYAE